MCWCLYGVRRYLVSVLVLMWCLKLPCKCVGVDEVFGVTCKCVGVDVVFGVTCKCVGADMVFGVTCKCVGVDVVFTM